MRNHLLADRYARALSETIEDLAELETTARTLTAFARVYTESHDLRNTLSNPALSVPARRTVLQSVLQKMEMPERVAAFVTLLLERQRIALLPDTADCFNQHVDTRLNRIGAVATTAVDLPDAARARLEQSLVRFSGKQVRLECQVDSGVVGGVTVRMGGLLLDGSLRTRLKRLSEMLLNAELA